MDAGRVADELASRCVALVIYYQHARKSRLDRAAITAEFRAVAAEARKSGIAPSVIAPKVLAELRARYGPEAARRLYGEYAGGFSEDIPINLVST